MVRRLNNGFDSKTALVVALIVAALLVVFYFNLRGQIEEAKKLPVYPSPAPTVIIHESSDTNTQPGELNSSGSVSGAQNGATAPVTVVQGPKGDTGATGAQGAKGNPGNPGNPSVVPPICINGTIGLGC